MVIGNNVKKIGKGAFAGCKKLKVVKIGNSVKTIGEAAFANCKKLKKVIIGNKVKTIKANAFRNCKSLKLVKIKSGRALKKVGKNAFKGVNKKTKFSIIANSKNYKRVVKLIKKAL